MYISTNYLPFLLQEICGPILEIAHGHMNVKIYTETAEIPRKGTHEWDFCCSAPAGNFKRGRNHVMGCLTDPKALQPADFETPKLKISYI